jgi:Flp pilus assembly protein TadG
MMQQQNRRRFGAHLGRGGSRGQAVVELALILPVLLLCCMGMLDFGRGLNAWSVMQNAAREGAFFAAKNPADPTLASDVKTVVLAEASPLLSAATVGNIVVSGPSTLDGTLVEKTDSVTVTYNFQLATPVFSGQSILFTAVAAAPEGP